MADFLYLEVEETSLSVTVLAINQKTNNLILEVKKLNIHYRENPTIHVICYTPRGRYINCISLPVDCVRIPLPPLPSSTGRGIKKKGKGGGGGGGGGF